MPGRKYAATASAKYRFSINGQEKETEVNENITTALYWEYDSRIVRRWNVDPIVKDYESPYLSFSGNPILFSDPNGDDVIVGENTKGKKNFKEKSKKEYLNDLKNKTGLDLIISAKGRLESKGVLTNEGISETARKELLNAIGNSITIAVDFINDKNQRSHVDPENRTQIFINTSKYVFPTADINQTTVGSAMTFFHELFHTPLHNNFEHKQIETGIDEPDIFTNKIRLELSISQKSNYGQRLAYTGMSAKPGGTAFIPMTTSAREVYDKLLNLWNIYFDSKSTSSQKEAAKMQASQIKIPKTGILLIK